MPPDTEALCQPPPPPLLVPCAPPHVQWSSAWPCSPTQMFLTTLCQHPRQDSWDKVKQDFSPAWLLDFWVYTPAVMLFSSPLIQGPYKTALTAATDTGFYIVMSNLVNRPLERELQLQRGFKSPPTPHERPEMEDLESNGTDDIWTEPGSASSWRQHSADGKGASQAGAGCQASPPGDLDDDPPLAPRGLRGESAVCA